MALFPDEKEDMLQLAKAAGKVLPVKPLVAVGKKTPCWQFAGECPFLTATNTCSIYPKRPLGCRCYPLIYAPNMGLQVRQCSFYAQAKQRRVKVRFSKEMLRATYQFWSRRVALIEDAMRAEGTRNAAIYDLQRGWELSLAPAEEVRLSIHVRRF